MNCNVIFCHQRELYTLGKITAAVRLLKGQEILHDDSTLEQHAIKDDSTVSVIIEPEKEIDLRIEFGPETFYYKSKVSMSVRSLKQTMIDFQQVALVQRDFDLVHTSLTKETVLDASLPLHQYALTDGVVLQVRLAFLRINIEQIGSRIPWSRKMPRKATVKQLKEIIAEDICKNPRADISVYYEGTKKLDDVDVLGDVVENDHDRFYFAENKTFQQFREVFFKGVSLGYIGVEDTDARDDLKYRAQDQLGVPFSKIHVKVPKPHHWDRIDGYVIEVDKGENVGNNHED